MQLNIQISQACVTSRLRWGGKFCSSF